MLALTPDHGVCAAPFAWTPSREEGNDEGKTPRSCQLSRSCPGAHKGTASENLDFPGPLPTVTALLCCNGKRRPRVGKDSARVTQCVMGTVLSTGPRSLTWRLFPVSTRDLPPYLGPGERGWVRGRALPVGSCPSFCSTEEEPGHQTCGCTCF